MWILIRLLVFAVAFAIRLRRHWFPPKKFGELDGDIFYYSVTKHKGKVRSYRVGVAFPVPVVFRLQAEDASDGFFKAIGYAKEFQTGDVHFDQNIYIASDHPALFEHLRERDEARRLVVDAIQSGYHRVSADGSYLWLEHKGEASPSETDIARVDELHNAFKDIGRRIRLRADRYNARVVVVEALTYSIGFYALATFFEMVGDDADLHVDTAGLITLGLGVALIMFLVLVSVIRALLGESSRGHRILVEGALVLLLAIPVTGINLVSEVNRRLDVSAPVMISREVTQRFYTTTRRKGRTRYHYYVAFADAPTIGKTTLPGKMKVSRSQWQSLPRRGLVWQNVGQGYLGFVWYRGFSRSP